MNIKKSCFKCGEVKGLSDFYKHKRMADGHVNKCKECNKKDVRKNRFLKVNYYREYDLARVSRSSTESCREYRKRFPKKYRATTMVNNAIKYGNLYPEPCSKCGRNYNCHAHHDDYSKPMNVRWLCSPCHSDWHKENGEAKNSI